MNLAEQLRNAKPGQRFLTKAGALLKYVDADSHALYPLRFGAGTAIVRYTLAGKYWWTDAHSQHDIKEAVDKSEDKPESELVEIVALPDTLINPEV